MHGCPQFSRICGRAIAVFIHDDIGPAQRGVGAHNRKSVLNGSPDGQGTIRHRQRGAKAQGCALPGRSAQIALKCPKMTESQFGAIGVIDAVDRCAGADVAPLDICAQIISARA